MSYYSEKELKTIGLKSCGKNVLISKNISIYGAKNISIGDNVRIDDFCILSGSISLKNNIHISAGVYIFAGDAGVDIGNFSGISSRTIIYAVSDDFSGDFLVGPMVPQEYRKVKSAKVELGEHVQIGASCVVLPGVNLRKGVSVGAMSLVNKNLENWSINAGIPAKKIKERSDKLKILEYKLGEENGKNNGN